LTPDGNTSFGSV